MAFTVEDGTGVKGANSFATVQGFKDYHADRGNDVTSFADEAIQQALIKSTDYIKTRFDGRFLGQPRWQTLLSRSILSISRNPLEGDTVTFGDQTYTFRSESSTGSGPVVGDTQAESLGNLLEVIAESNNDSYRGFLQPDLDVTTVAIFADQDGVVTTSALTGSSFNDTKTAGQSQSPQTLPFPRLQIFTSDGRLLAPMPTQLIEATYQYALRSVQGTTLAPDLSFDESGGKVTLVREQVGPIEVETRYSESSALRISRSIPEADRLLATLLRTTGGSIRN